MMAQAPACAQQGQAQAAPVIEGRARYNVVPRNGAGQVARKAGVLAVINADPVFAGR